MLVVIHYSLLVEKLVHKCKGTRGSMSKVMKPLIRRGCLNPVSNAGNTIVDAGASANLDIVDVLLPRRLAECGRR